MKYVDFAFQTIILLLVLLSFMAGLAEDGTLGAGGLASMYAAMLIGPWQLVSSALSLFAKAPYAKLKRIHLVLSFAYFAAMALLLGFLLPWTPEWLKNTILFVPPVILSLYYYFLTWIWVFQSQARSKFLPHINY